MRKNKLNTKRIMIKLLTLVTVIGACILLYLSINGLGKILYLYILIVFIIPIIAFYTRGKLMKIISPKQKLVVDSKGKISTVEPNKIIMKGENREHNQNSKSQKKAKYEKSESPNLQLDIYKQVSKTFSNGMKEKLLKRSDIIQFKKELNKLLDTNINHYEGFNFENDAHEVYVKLKNQYLRPEDYEYLLTYIDILMRNNLTKEEIV